MLNFNEVLPACIINRLPLLFKALLHGQKDSVFFQWAFKMYRTAKAL
jgi:hypothetical protein